MSKTLKDKILEQFGACTPKYILSQSEDEILRYMEMLENVFDNSVRGTSRNTGVGIVLARSLGSKVQRENSISHTERT